MFGRPISSRSYGAAKSEIGLSARHEQRLRKSHRAENSNQPTDKVAAVRVVPHSRTADGSREAFCASLRTSESTSRSRLW